jgi:uncharacterized protein (TIGR03089 family)
VLNLWNEISRALKNAGPTPVVTWLSPKGRIELSGQTLLNAVSKAGNYLIDGCGFDQQSSISVELENHWQATVWKLAALVSGIGLADSSSNKFSFSDSISSGNQYIVSRDPFGMPEKELPLGAENVSLEVRSHGDYFSPSYSLKDFAFQNSEEKLTEKVLFEMVDKSILDYGTTGRYGLDLKTNGSQALILQALVPALTDNSVVLFDGVAPAEHHLVAEKITKVISI